MSNAQSALVWFHSEAEASARLVLLAIADHDGEGGAWPSVATMARMTRLSESTVRRCIKALAVLGELTVHLQDGGTNRTPKHHRPNRYEIHLACPPTCDGTARHRTVDNPVDNSSEPVDNTPCHHDTPCHSRDTPPPVIAMTPEPPIEPPITPPTPPTAPTVPQSVAQLWTGEGIAEEYHQPLWALVLADPGTVVPAARARQRAWFGPALAGLKAQSAATRSDAIKHLRKFGADCDHGTPGGAEPHPTTGLPLCPLCRAKVLA